jgi:hypothetical protein
VNWHGACLYAYHQSRGTATPPGESAEAVEQGRE